MENNDLVKVYVHGSVESDDPRLYTIVKLLSKEMERQKDDLKKMEYLKGRYKELCQSIRKQLKIENVIGFVRDEKKIEVVITIYAVRDTGDNFYDQVYDPEEKKPYIVAREEDLVDGTIQAV